MQEKIDNIIESVKTEILNASNKQELIQINAKYLGKSGELSLLMRGLKDLSPAEKPKMGAILNQARDQVFALVRQKEEVLNDQELAQRINNEHVDITMPVKPLQSANALSPMAVTG